MKKVVTFLCGMALVVFGAGALILTGCGLKTLDMSGITFESVSEVYNEDVHTLTVKGELPKGVVPTYTYYTDVEYTDESRIDAPTNVGVYYVKVTFAVPKGYKAVDEMKATLTITKADFGKVDFVIGGTFEGESGEETVVAKDNGDGTYYLEYNVTPYTLTAVSGSADGRSLIPTIEYFRGMDTDGTLTDPELSNNTLSEIGERMYMRATFVDDNHNSKSIVKVVNLEKKTVEISDWEDLQLVRTQITGGTYKDETIAPISRENRKSIRYLLKNDIDCEGQVWVPVKYSWNNGAKDGSFASEFDGNGYTISNYVINNESFDAAQVSAGGGMLFLGFFGVANDCEIHDVTFEGIKIKLDKNDEAYSAGRMPIFAGIVVGRLDVGASQGGLADGCMESNLYNINVKNCKIDINAYKQHVGGVIGWEVTGHDKFGRRENIVVEDCSIYVNCADEKQNVYAGGLVGRLVGEAVEGASVWKIQYDNCKVKNIKIGYNYEAVMAVEGAVKEDGKFDRDNPEVLKLIPYWETDLKIGGFFGSMKTMNLYIKGCSLENYFITTTSGTGYYANKEDPSTLYLDGVNTHTNDAQWNNGVNGVYNQDGENKTSTDEETHLDWIWS